jgi:DNA helicase-2/ATP-dependent DNA helicase PcrA
MEEGLFPSAQSIDDLVRLEEERRLAYVGITRARKQLYLTHAESRRLYGKETYPRPSRFLRDIPAELLQEVRVRATLNYAPESKPRTVYHNTATPKPQPRTIETNNTYKTGQKVSHAKFGAGIVIATVGEGDKESVMVNFKQVGVKQLMLAYAKLDVL